jgi:hypothetical protein
MSFNVPVLLILSGGAAAHPARRRKRAGWSLRASTSDGSGTLALPPADCNAYCLQKAGNGLTLAARRCLSGGDPPPGIRGASPSTPTGSDE